MRLVIKHVLVGIVIFFGLLVLTSTAKAQQWCGGCQVDPQSYTDPDTGQLVWINGCDGCTAANCPSGQYEAPDGTCHNVGSGACECGEKADGSCKPCNNNRCDGVNLWPVTNCPQGTTRSNNVLSSVCYTNGQVSCYPPGTAQLAGGCCSTRTIRGTCSDWYSCPTPNNPNKMCRDCTPDETVCTGTTVTTYQCVSICSGTAPTNLSVTAGASATSANLSWTSGSGGSSQRIYVSTSQSSVNNNCVDGQCIVNAVMSPVTANTHYSYPTIAGLQSNTTYYFKVATYENASCIMSATTSYTTPDISLSGRVYLDTDNNCSTATPWSLGGLTVAIPSTAYSGTVGSDGRFGFYGGTTSPISLVLSGYSASYVPSTASGCNSGATLSSVTNPSSTNYFYLTSRREAWWQAVGASVYAEGNVRSELPSASVNLIDTGSGGAVGALMKSTGSVDTGAGSVSSAGYTATTKYKGKLMNYDYFAAHMGVTPNTVNDWAADTMNKPANNPNKLFYYINPSGSEASVSSPWTVAAGESYVIFVNGDLRIASNITVANGGFLAFIVNGSVRVSPAVTDIAGLYIIDSTLITESNGTTDVPANFQGSVVAWGGVNFGRDLVASNVSQPGEKFTYRADLLNNMPDSMKVFALKWEEVVPGTFNQ